MSRKDSLKPPVPQMLALIDVLANDIDPAGVELEAELPVAWLGAKLADAEARAVSPGRIAGRLSRSGRADIVVRARIECDVEVPCARCLDPAAVAVRTELSLLLKPAPSKLVDGARTSKGSKKASIPKVTSTAAEVAAKASIARPAAKGKKPPRDKPSRGEYEFAAPEADLDEYDGERVVLDEFVREAILLELPSFPLCREDCGRADRGRDAVNGHLLSAQDDGGGDAPESEPATDLSRAVRTNPFEALRHLFSGGNPLPSQEMAGMARPPSPAEQKRATRGKKRKKPRIQSSAVGRSKK